MLTFTNFTVTVSFADFSTENWEALVRDSINPENTSVTVVPWTSSHILYGLPLHQKGDVSKATC